MKMAEIERIRTDKKHGLAIVKKRVVAALRTPSYVDVRPQGVLFDGKHSISFTIYGAYGRVDGEVTYIPEGI